MGFVLGISASSLLALVSLTSALTIPDLANSSVNGVLELPFKRVKTASSSKGNLTTRGDSFNFPITNWDEIGYFTDIKVGTPPQTISVLIDTGSADVVFDQTKYDPSKSSTSKSKGSVSTQWGTEFKLYNDTVTTDLFTLEDYRVATWDHNVSLLGLGPRSGEQATTSVPGKWPSDPWTVDEYNNVPYALAAAGLINKPAFSVYLQDEPYDDDSFTHSYTNGVILFGGIDHAKYVGDLASYPIANGQWATIQLDWMHWADGSSYEYFGPAIIDTGTTTSSFPQVIVDRIKDLFAPYDSAGNIINYNESWANEFLEFQFGSNTVKVPYTDFVATNGNGGYRFSKLYSDTSIILGDIFLRNAYTVFDYASGNISIAQAAKNAYNSSNITVIS